MVLVNPLGYPLYFFRVVVIGLDLPIIDPCAFLFVTGTMFELYNFEDLVAAM